MKLLALITLLFMSGCSWPTEDKWALVGTSKIINRFVILPTECTDKQTYLFQTVKTKITYESCGGIIAYVCTYEQCLGK